MTKILITGGAGYIGSVLTNEILENNYHVTVLDNFLYKQTSLNHFCSNKNFNFIYGDCRDELLIKKIISKFDIIIPLAAIVGAPACNKDPIAAKSINNDSFDLILNNISPNQLIIMPTSNSAYGSGDKNNFCNEDSPLNPISLYARDKVEVEKKLLDHKNSISLRLATVFGASPRMRTDLLVNDFVYRAVNDKFIVLFESHFKRNFIHVRDVSRCFLFAIKNFDMMNNNIFNVGLDDANLSKKELCDVIKKYIPDFMIYEDDINQDPDQRNYIVSNEKLIKCGFKTSFTLDKGVIELKTLYSMINNNKFNNI